MEEIKILYLFTTFAKQNRRVASRQPRYFLHAAKK